MSLRARLLLLVLIAVVPAFGLVLSTASEQRRLATVEAQASALQLARVVARQHDELMAGTQGLLVALSSIPEVRGTDSEACRRVLADLLGQYRRYTNFGLADASGALHCSALPSEQPISVADRAYFQRAVRTRDFAVGDYQIGLITQRATLGFGYPVIDNAGQITALVVAALDLAWVHEFASQVDLPPGAALTVIDRNGAVLARYPQSEVRVGGSLPHASLVLANPGEGVTEILDADGIPRLVGFTPLRAGSEVGFAYVSIEIPSDVAYAEVGPMLARNLAGLGLAAALAALAAWFGGELFIFRRVRALLDAAGRLGSGDLSVRTSIPYGDGELGQLARAFDEMAASLQEHEQRLRQFQKMEAIGRLSGGIAHDFNNLLTAIIGFGKLLEERAELEGPHRTYLEEIIKNGERAAALTGQLLAFSRQQVLRPEVLDLNAVVANMDRLLQRVIGEDIDLVTLLEPSLGRVKADPGQVEQVVLNLAVNARDAMPGGGKLTIETSNVELDDAYVRGHLAGAPGPHVMLAVSDTGVGMDAETQARIFEPFFTTKEQGKGTGMGLATVYGIVKQSGGYIWVYSEPGHGATFKVYLPLVADDVTRRTSIIAPETLSRGSETVLLVEDEDGVRRLASEVLQANGYRVIEARDGDEARVACEGHEGPIHLLLTDVVMPGLSGRELASALTALRPEMKVLYMSGYTDDAALRHGVLQESDAFLEKPFTPAALTRKVGEALKTSKKEVLVESA